MLVVIFTQTPSDVFWEQQLTKECSFRFLPTLLLQKYFWHFFSIISKPMRDRKFWEKATSCWKCWTWFFPQKKKEYNKGNKLKQSAKLSLEKRRKESFLNILVTIKLVTAANGLIEVVESLFSQLIRRAFSVKNKIISNIQLNASNSHPFAPGLTKEKSVAAQSTIPRIAFLKMHCGQMPADPAKTTLRVQETINANKINFIIF